MNSIIFENSNRYFEIIRYLLVSVFAYIYILAAIYVLIDFLGVNHMHAYVMVYLSAYTINYVLILKYVFEGRHNWIKVLKFVVYIVISLILSTIFFEFILSIGIHYLLSVILTAVLLMPFRFLANKNWVYR